MPVPKNHSKQTEKNNVPSSVQAKGDPEARISRPCTIAFDPSIDATVRSSTTRRMARTSSMQTSALRIRFIRIRKDRTGNFSYSFCFFSLSYRSVPLRRSFRQVLERLFFPKSANVSNIATQRVQFFQRRRKEMISPTCSLLPLRRIYDLGTKA